MPGFNSGGHAPLSRDGGGNVDENPFSLKQLIRKRNWRGIILSMPSGRRPRHGWGCRWPLISGRLATACAGSRWNVLWRHDPFVSDASIRGIILSGQSGFRSRDRRCASEWKRCQENSPAVGGLSGFLNSGDRRSFPSVPTRKVVPQSCKRKRIVPMVGTIRLVS